MRADFLGRNTLRLVAAAAGAVVLAGCDSEPASPTPLDPGDISPYVVPALAGELDAQGRFRPAPPEPESFPQITADQAMEIAVAFARTFAPYIRSYLERQHGARIDFESLTVVSPAYYAITPYRDIPAELHPGLRNGVGPHFLVYLGEHGAPILSVAVAAFAEARVEDGRLVLPVRGGDEIQAYGVRRGEGFAMPTSPEQAARQVGLATGARVVTVPQLVLPEKDYAPQYARWKIVLDRPVSVRATATGRRRETGELYVGLRGELSVRAERQPDGITLDDPSTGRSFMVGRKPDRDVAFERITLASQ